MQFITIAHPSDKDSPHLRRQAHSHAARNAHARVRRIRVARHAAERTASQTAASSTTHSEVCISLARSSAGHHPGLVSSVPASISSAFEHEPLATFLRSLTSRENYLFNHYIHVVAPTICDRCPILDGLNSEHRQRVRDNWAIMTSTDIEILRGTLLSACRWLSIIQEQAEYAELAIEYKLRLVRDLQGTISIGNLLSSRRAVSKALVLVCDEIIIRDMAMATAHVMGALQIIRAAGGIEVLDLSCMALFLLSSCVHGKRLLDADPGIEIPRSVAFLNHM
ncbi:hypothetical protein N658DRAFT_435552 [Parathielavia hyrcaniae]|uniref:Uncharacterized protein n=1 Tax=Parathielavia hyrcaniae TaxID=113614 RepID=A0AAN6SWS3_9PEZI|nr:hypothetical protein N658DRAFT_435552 [Parathielavia hyrcaniae]